MEWLVYERSKEGVLSILSKLRPVQIAGRSGMFASYVRREAKGGYNPFVWHMISRQLLEELGADAGRQALVLDCFPECADPRLLSVVSEVWGYSYEEVTFLGVRLYPICNQDKDPGESTKDRLVQGKPEVSAVFVRLDGGLAGGSWSAKEVDSGFVKAAKPDAYVALKAKLGIA